MAALDPHTRGRVRAELRMLLHELGLPSILVTHDFVDAAALSDRIAVLVEGTHRPDRRPPRADRITVDAIRRGARGRNLLAGNARCASTA
jgi:molybdate transport system ATP-binding protein